MKGKFVLVALVLLVLIAPKAIRVSATSDGQGFYQLSIGLETRWGTEEIERGEDSEEPKKKMELQNIYQMVKDLIGDSIAMESNDL